jgi:hypothetical protein
MRDLRRLLRDLIPDGRPHGAAPDVTLEVRSPSPSGGGWLLRDGVEILRTGCYPYLLACLDHEIGKLVAERAMGHYLLHAGAVARAGRGILLPGDRGAGKTTLVAFLVKHGFLFYADEMAALEVGSARLAPLPRPMRLKGGSARLLAPFDGRLEIAPFGGDPGAYPGRYALPQPRGVGRSPCRPAFILYLHRTPGARAKLTPVRGGEAVLGLARRAFRSERLGENGLDFLVGLVGRVPCFRFEFDDLGEALDAVRALVEGGGWDRGGGLTAEGAASWPGPTGVAHRRRAAG